jgi:hypothetical protein
MRALFKLFVKNFQIVFEKPAMQKVHHYTKQLDKSYETAYPRERLDKS